MRQQMLRCLLACLLLAGCGGGGKSPPDAPPDLFPPPPVDLGSTPDIFIPPPPPPVDAGPGCDDDAMGEDFCIKNPGDNRGGGTPVPRQDPGKCSP